VGVCDPPKVRATADVQVDDCPERRLGDRPRQTVSDREILATLTLYLHTAQQEGSSHRRGGRGLAASTIVRRVVATPGDGG
jgi:hypothetical protein